MSNKKKDAAWALCDELLEISAESEKLLFITGLMSDCFDEPAPCEALFAMKWRELRSLTHIVNDYAIRLDNLINALHELQGGDQTDNESR